MSLRSDCLLASTGIRPKEITERHHTSALGRPESWRKRLRSLVLADESEPFIYREPPDLEKIFHELALPPGEDQMAIWLEGAGLRTDGGLAGEYIGSLMKARQYFVDAFPKRTYPSVAGPKIIPLNGDDIDATWQILMVLDGADHVLEEMEQGTLMPAQATAFRENFPKLFNHANEVLLEVFAERLAKDKDWEPRREVDVMVRVLRGLPPEEQPPAPAPPPAAPAKFQIAPESVKTQGQLSETPRAPGSP